MKPFTFSQPATTPEALAGAQGSDSAFIAGGTTLVDLWKLGAFSFDRLIDINLLEHRGIVARPNELHLGALEKMSAVGSHPDVVTNYPVLSQALLLSASPQIRNMASMGGNLLQRPRSLGFRNPDPHLMEGQSRFDAIYGVTKTNAAPYPSDLAVALLALDANLHLQQAQGERTVKVADFYQVRQDDRNLWAIQEGELITLISAQVPFARRSAYVKIRDRASYQFAITSAAVILDLDGDNIREARIAAGGVGTVPWRFREIEAKLKGQPATVLTYLAALTDLSEGAITHPLNQYKIELLRQTILRGLTQAQNNI